MEEIKCEQVGQIVGSGFTEMTGRVYGIDGLSPTVRTLGGGNTEVKIAEPIIYDDYNGRIRTDQDFIGTLTTNSGSYAIRNGVKIIEPIAYDEQNCYRIRKLTERECFRLMGVRDEDFEKVRYGQPLPKNSYDKIATRTMTKTKWKECYKIMRHHRQSVSSCVHLAGDSIVTTCLMAIFGQLLNVADYNDKITDLTNELKEGD